MDQDYYLDYNISNAIISKLHLEHNCVLRRDCVVKPVESATNKSNQNELIFKIRSCWSHTNTTFKRKGGGFRGGKENFY